MQNFKIYAVYDKKAQAYRYPHFLKQHGEAIRALEDSVNETQNSQNQIARHPADFALCHLGDFDDSTGKIIGLNAPVIIQEAISLKGEKNA